MDWVEEEVKKTKLLFITHQINPVLSESTCGAVNVMLWIIKIKIRGNDLVDHTDPVL